MKKIFTVFILLLTSNFIKAQTITESEWEKVIVTNNPYEVKGLKRAGEVIAEASKIFGKESKLRDEATKKIKKEAAKIGASFVLLQNDNFGNSPINNITMKGVAYK